jgi:hypothetical protein
MSKQLLLAGPDTTYRDQLVAIISPEALDKWFNLASHCFLGGSCFDCCAFECGKCQHSPARCPFCVAFACGECGCDCATEDFGWLQDLMDKAEANGVWK